MPNLNQTYQWAINTCNNPNVGYWQDYRNQKTVNGITYYDCSSFVWYALQAGGFDVSGQAYKTAVGEAYTGNAITTHTEKAWLQALGWTQIPLTGEWKPCDILWRSGHTEMVYEGGTGTGRTMGAHGRNNIALVDQVSIKTTWDTASQWESLWRYGSGGATDSYSLYVISAIAGNFYQESNINPALWEGTHAGTWTDLNKGYGLGQWTNTGGNTHGRLYQLHQWLSDNNYLDDSGLGQIKYLIEENVWYSVQEASSYKNLSEFLSSDSTDITALTHAFNIGWEGIHDASWNDRVTYANECYTFIQSHLNDISITDWVTGNRYLNTSEIMNNAVMLARALGSQKPVTPPTPPLPPQPIYGKGKMPVWMMCKYY